MKIRIGFVSNSSSSSFVCDVCDKIESGMDASLEDLGFVKCENEHYICDECIDTSEITLIDDEDEGEVNILSEKDCPLCQFKKLGRFDSLGYLMAEYKLDNEKILADLRKRFKNYKEFSAFVRKEK